MIVVSDTSPLNALQRIGLLQVLPALFGRVIIPLAVRQELDIAVAYGLDLKQIDHADWLEIRSLTNDIKKSELLKFLDPGESEAIALALEL